MITAALHTSGIISEVTDYTLFAKAQLGDNTAITSGAAELLVGTPGDSAAIHTCWDSTPEEFDSGPRSAKLTADADAGTVAWSLEGSETVSQTYGSNGALGKVQIRAGISVPGMVQWSWITIQWYRDGVMVDRHSRRMGPVVDERGVEGPVEAEQVLTVSTSVRNADKVVVWGDVAIAYDPGVYAGPDDLFAEVFVFPSA